MPWVKHRPRIGLGATDTPEQRDQIIDGVKADVLEIAQLRDQLKSLCTENTPKNKSDVENQGQKALVMLHDLDQLERDVSLSLNALQQQIDAVRASKASLSARLRIAAELAEMLPQKKTGP